MLRCSRALFETILIRLVGVYGDVVFLLLNLSVQANTPIVNV